MLDDIDIGELLDLVQPFRLVSPAIPFGARHPFNGFSEVVVGNEGQSFWILSKTGRVVQRPLVGIEERLLGAAPAHAHDVSDAGDILGILGDQINLKNIVVMGLFNELDPYVGPTTIYGCDPVFDLGLQPAIPTQQVQTGFGQTGLATAVIDLHSRGLTK